jgi:hypothetical protein
MHHAWSIADRMLVFNLTLFFHYKSINKIKIKNHHLQLKKKQFICKESKEKKNQTKNVSFNCHQTIPPNQGHSTAITQHADPTQPSDPKERSVPQRHLRRPSITVVELQ